MSTHEYTCFNLALNVLSIWIEAKRGRDTQRKGKRGWERGWERERSEKPAESLWERRINKNAEWNRFWTQCERKKRTEQNKAALKRKKNEMNERTNERKKRNKISNNRHTANMTSKWLVWSFAAAASKATYYRSSTLFSFHSNTIHLNFAHLSFSLCHVLYALRSLVLLFFFGWCCSCCCCCCCFFYAFLLLPNNSPWFDHGFTGPKQFASCAGAIVVALCTRFFSLSVRRVLYTPTQANQEPFTFLLHSLFHINECAEKKEAIVNRSIDFGAVV